MATNNNMEPEIETKINIGSVTDAQGNAYNPLLQGKLGSKLNINPADIKKININADRVGYGAKPFKNGYLDATSHKSSIIGMAKGNIFEFPVFVSDTVPLEMATATNSLLEQVYASYLQMAISINPVIDSASLKEKGGQFSRFKTNTTKYLESAELSYQHDACHAKYRNDDGVIVEFDMMSITDNDANIINEYCDKSNPLSEFDHYFQEGGPNPNTGDEWRRINQAWRNINNRTQQLDARERTLNTNENRNLRDEARHLEDRFTWDQNDRNSRFAAARNTIYNPESGIAMPDAEMLQRMASGQATDADYDRLEQITSMNGGSIKNALANRELQNYDLDHYSRLENLYANTDKLQAELRKLQREEDLIRRYREENNGDDPEYMKLVDETKERQIKLGMLLSSYRDQIDKIKADATVAKEDVDRKREKHQMDVEKHKLDTEKHYHDTKIKASTFVDETKLQKLNSMKPLMMITNLSYMDKNGSVSRPIEYVVGVKTHCRLVESAMLPEVVQYPLKEMDKVMRKAKWRAGELKLFKDIIFRIKEKKQTAIDSRDPRRKWYRRLYELAHMKGDGNVSKAIAGPGSTGGLIPNATIMISKADVDNIESVTGIDVLDASKARKLCEELFLMAFVVIDTDAESIKILTPDINNEFEVQSLGAVRKQVAQLSTVGEKTMDVFKSLR